MNDKCHNEYSESYKLQKLKKNEKFNKSCAVI